MSIITIRSKITTALSTWAATKSIPLVRESQAFTPPANNGTYIELYVLPADTFSPTVNGVRKRYVGEVVINIHSQDGVGTALSEGLAEEIAALFPVVPKTYLPVSVETTPSIKRAVVEANGMRVTPVVFTYRAEF